MRMSMWMVMVGVALGRGVGMGAESAKVSQAFDQVGYVVEVRALFAMAAGEAGADSMAAVQDTVAGRAFVAGDGQVFAFLETPRNREWLGEIEPGAAVRLEGKLLPAGKLLQIDRLAKGEQGPEIDFAALRNHRGEEVALQGVNKCQCGLGVGDLEHSCSLGHLHHLETGDGKIYHYLQSATGQGLFLGKGAHFKQVVVKGRLLPGNYLVVEGAQVVQ